MQNEGFSLLVLTNVQNIIDNSTVEDKGVFGKRLFNSENKEVFIDNFDGNTLVSLEIKNLVSYYVESEWYNSDFGTIAWTYIKTTSEETLVPLVGDTTLLLYNNYLYDIHSPYHEPHPHHSPLITIDKNNIYGTRATTQDEQEDKTRLYLTTMYGLKDKGRGRNEPSIFKGKRRKGFWYK